VSASTVDHVVPEIPMIVLAIYFILVFFADELSEGELSIRLRNPIPNPIE